MESSGDLVSTSDQWSSIFNFTRVAMANRQPIGSQFAGHSVVAFRRMFCLCGRGGRKFWLIYGRKLSGSLRAKSNAAIFAPKWRINTFFFMPFGVFIVIIYVSHPKAGSIIFVYCPNRLHRRQPTVIDNALIGNVSVSVSCLTQFVEHPQLYRFTNCRSKPSRTHLYCDNFIGCLTV